MNDGLDFQLLNNRGLLKMQKAIKSGNRKVLESGIADVRCAIQSFSLLYPEKMYYIAEANLIDALNLEDKLSAN